jgi:hypothetical protein
LNKAPFWETDSNPSGVINGEISKIGDTFIKNIQYPPCISCKYFQLYVPKELYNDRNASLHQSKCKKFGYMDIISSEIRYEVVGKTRFDKNMCKIDGIYYTKRGE